MNPYLQNQAAAITQQANQNLTQNQLPAINSAAIAAGGYGGSRQGIAQGLAIGQTNQGIANSLASLYGNAYESDANRALQQQSINNQYTLGQGQLALGNRQADQSYSLGQGNLALGQTQAANNYALGQQQNQTQAQSVANQYSLGQQQNTLQGQQIANSYSLGMGNLGLGSQVADQNFFTAQRGQDLSALGLGSQLATNANLGLASQGQQLYQNGLTQQQAPLNTLQQYANLLSPFTGLNSSTVRETPGTSTLGGAVGGALTAAQLWNLLTKTNTNGG